MNKSVVITQIRLTHYRVAFFEALRTELKNRDIELILVHGQPAQDEMFKRDTANVDWAVFSQNKYWRIRNTNIVWQPFPVKLRNSDLVVITQENRILSNYFHILKRIFFGSKLAFWGHGANLQSQNPNGLKERFKRWTTNYVDWWFAYTQMSSELVQASGFPANRISVLNNSVDTSDLLRQRKTITPMETQLLKISLGLETGPVGVFVGSLYADKRLDFLFASAEGIRKEIPNFQLLIVGDGNELDKVQAWCAEHSWTRWVGIRLSREKAAYLSVAQIMLNPGLVGLGVLDSFACEVPMLTTTCGFHSPEITYLKNGINGVITPDQVSAYINACVDLLRAPEKLEMLRAGCRASASEYTVENMARRFADGIVSVLAG